MSQGPNADITALLGAWEKGDDQALGRVIELVYDELRKIARFHLEGPAGQSTLQPTALVHEVYQRLAGAGKPTFENRTHFFNCARVIMRQVLMYRARKHRLGDGTKVKKAAFDDDFFLPRLDDLDPRTLLSMDSALDKLAEMDRRGLAIVELRFFVGLNIEETAEILDISSRTVRREWLATKRWLARELSAASSAR